MGSDKAKEAGKIWWVYFAENNASTAMDPVSKITKLIHPNMNAGNDP